MCACVNKPTTLLRWCPSENGNARKKLTTDSHNVSDRRERIFTLLGFSKSVLRFFFIQPGVRRHQPNAWPARPPFCVYPECTNQSHRIQSARANVPLVHAECLRAPTVYLVNLCIRIVTWISIFKLEKLNGHRGQLNNHKFHRTRCLSESQLNISHSHYDNL